MDRRETTALLRSARDGSDAALEILFERYAPRLLALIRLRMGPSLRAHLESRDVLHASLLKAFRRIERFEGADGSTLMAWLARIATNEIRDQADYHRRQRRDAGRVVPLDDGLDRIAAEVRSGISRVVLNERLERLERALESLDDDHREIILLRRFEERSFREIGERMGGRSPDACRMLLARAMTALTLRMREAENA